jgi:hypothetical protein
MRTYFTIKHLKNFVALLIAGILFFSSTAIGQSGNLDQVRNGPKTNPQKNFYKTFDNPTWVNGNAGSSDAHYTEGMSIAYRSLLTGLTPGTCYEYVIEYDTYHGAMAIDYLTHYQRLEPHSPFGHTAETIDPLIFKSGSTEYKMHVYNTDDQSFVAPDNSGITSGSTLDIHLQPTTSFNNLPNAEKVMTIFNGSLISLNYDKQDPIAISGNNNTASQVRIIFTADHDSVVLAWGGHIASRLDWGNNTSTGKPLSAGGISGSPYHMRQISMKICGAATNLSGVGNQDRSLSAAAVVPPPTCVTVPSQTKCEEATSFTFTIASPQAGATYSWAFASNTANAAFQGGTNTGTTVTIVPGSGGSFTPGSFTFNITASLNSINQLCSNVATGTVLATPSVATVYNPPGCSDHTFTVDVPSPTIGYTYSIDQPDNTDDFSSQTQTPTVAGAIHFTGLKAGDGFVVTVSNTSGSVTCSGTSDCGSSTNSCASNNTATRLSTETLVSNAIEPYNIVLGSPTKVSALPNPFKDKIKFNIVSAVSGFGSLELYNLTGQRVAMVYEGYVQAGKQLTKEFNASFGQRNALIYIFKVGDQKVSGKLIGLK